MILIQNDADRMKVGKDIGLFVDISFLIFYIGYSRHQNMATIEKNYHYLRCYVWNNSLKALGNMK